MRIGIVGGTFDPIHLGHIQPALAALTQLQLDKLWLMPNHIPPHKNGAHVSTEHRIAMVKDICQQYPQFELCDIEIERDSPSYSVTTLGLLKQTYPQHTFYFIMGMDSFVNLPSWYQWQSLFDYCHIALCARPGWTSPTDNVMQLQLHERICNNPTIQSDGGHIFRVDAPMLAISSTEIRQHLQQNKPLSTWLAKSTQEYIEQYQLYR
ncbi:nicotinate-nucleotide adenylyltransferase [Shewanella maritima]|uniref:nicotinate-nucleotide adenylyltransferase n=1 Tax=Shewanella maritima TaxID=2520507 RepID=UPI0037355FF0